MSHVLCIGGMHRSGTSLVASWLERCGLQIHDGKMAGPTKNNPEGHFEDLEFLRLHERLYREADPASRDWILTDPATIARLSLEHTPAAEMIARRNAKYPLWGWKEPRTCLLVKPYKALIPNMKMLWIWRPVEKVLSSLMRRSKNPAKGQAEHLDISPRQAIDLWKRCNEQGLEFARNHPNDIVVAALSDLTKCDQAVIAALNPMLGHMLKPVPYADVYKPELMDRKQPTPLRLHWAKLLMKLDSDLPELTRQLRSLSVKPQPQQQTAGDAVTA